MSNRLISLLGTFAFAFALIFATGAFARFVEILNKRRTGSGDTLLITVLALVIGSGLVLWAFDVMSGNVSGRDPETEDAYCAVGPPTEAC